MTYDPLRQIHPDLVAAAAAVKEKRERRNSLTISNAGVPGPSTEQIVDSIVHGKPTWRTIAQTLEDDRQAKLRERRAANELVPCPEPDPPSIEEARESGEYVGP